VKSKKTVIFIACIAAVLIVSVAVMALIGKKGAGDSVSAAREYLEASMRYDTKGMANTASDKVRQQLYNTGEIPTVKELIKQHFTMKELDYIASACSNYIEDLEIKQKQVNEELEKVKNEMWRIYEKVKAIREAGGSDVSV